MFDAFASVVDVQDKHLGVVTVGHTHTDIATLSELQRIFDQVDHNLLKPDFVAHERGKVSIIADRRQCS